MDTGQNALGKDLNTHILEVMCNERGDSPDNVMAADVSDVMLLLHDICIEYKQTSVSLLRTP